MTDVPYRTLRAEDALRDMTHHLTQAAHHANKAHDAQRLYLSLLPGGDNRVLPGLSEGRRRSAPRCVTEWTDFLQENGPSLRQEVQDGTGVKFSERAYAYTVVWEDGMEHHNDDEFMGDAIFRIRTVKEGGGRGGAPVAFFLWSQRYDVFDRFGVGPRSRPESTEPMLGVIQPPTAPIDWNEIPDLPEPTVVPDPEPEVEGPTRYANMDEWNERWVPLFEIFAKHGDTPSAEEKQEMRDTLPEDTNGEPWNVVLARTLYEAKVRLDG